MRTSVTKDGQRHRGSGTSSTGCQPADAPGSSLARPTGGPATVDDQRMTKATVIQRSVAAGAVGEQIEARRRAIGWRCGLRLPELEIASGPAT